MAEAIAAAPPARAKSATVIAFTAHAADDVSAERERLANDLAAVLKRRAPCAPADLKPPVVEEAGIEQVVTEKMSAAELHELPARVAKAAREAAAEKPVTPPDGEAIAATWLARAQAARRRATVKVLGAWALTILVGGGIMLAAAIALFGMPADFAGLTGSAARALRLSALF